MDEIYLMGQTAAGKNKVAIELAKRLNAEIISVDSMKVYKGLDVGTSKPPGPELKKVPHHLINIITPDKQFNVAMFIEKSREARDKALNKNRGVIYTGGAFLYYKALVYGFNKGIEGNMSIRTTLEADYNNNPELVFARLKKADYVTAAKITINDKKRIIRALEYYTITGKPLSENNIHFSGQNINVKGYALVSTAELLRSRIEKRSKWMVENGLIEETENLLDKFTPAKEITFSIGYREAIDHICSNISREEMTDSISKRTWTFARKQMTWIRSLKELKTIHVDDKSPDQIALRIVSTL